MASPYHPNRDEEAPGQAREPLSGSGDANRFSDSLSERPEDGGSDGPSEAPAPAPAPVSFLQQLRQRAQQPMHHPFGSRFNLLDPSPPQPAPSHREWE